MIYRLWKAHQKYSSQIAFHFIPPNRPKKPKSGGKDNGTKLVVRKEEKSENYENFKKIHSTAMNFERVEHSPDLGKRKGESVGEWIGNGANRVNDFHCEPKKKMLRRKPRLETDTSRRRRVFTMLRWIVSPSWRPKAFCVEEEWLVSLENDFAAIEINPYPRMQMLKKRRKNERCINTNGKYICIRIRYHCTPGDLNRVTGIMNMLNVFSVARREW